MPKAKNTPARRVATGIPSVVVNVSTKNEDLESGEMDIKVGGVVVNSPQTLHAAHAAELQQYRGERTDRLKQAVALANTLAGELGRGKAKGKRPPTMMGMTRNMGELGEAGMLRGDFLRFLLDGPRDIDAECGYPMWLTPDHYRAMYDREGIAKRVVDVEPEETWSMDPEVYEDEDPETDTDFENAWKAFLKKHNAWHYLQRLDVLSGIGQFGILLIGIDDGLDLREAVEGLDSNGEGQAGEEHTVLFLRPFSEEVVFVKTREVDPTNPRYGLPTMYTIHFRDYPNWGIQAGEIIARDVHWTRAIHAADNRKMSEIYGIPRMLPVYNRLYDLRKIYASSGEGFWKGAFPGISFEVNPELADQGVTMDSESMRKEMEKYQMGLQRYIATTGVTAKSLQPSVTDPTPSAECHLKAIAISKGIPYRVLFGSEEAKLAGAQDSRAWNKRLAKRQSKYVIPMLIRPFIDRLIQLRALPEPEEYEVIFPDLNAPTDQDKATISLTKTQAIAAYVQSGSSSLMAPRDFFVKIMGMTTEEADDLTEGMEEFGTEDTNVQDASVDDGDTEEGGESEGAPDNGDALQQTELARAGVKKPVDSTIVEAPALNKGVGKTGRRPFVGNFNPNHDDRGRFSDGPGGGGATGIGGTGRIAPGAALAVPGATQGTPGTGGIKTARGLAPFEGPGSMLGTMADFRDDKGEWTPERHAMHERLIWEALDRAIPVANPKVTVMGGGPASGKTTIINAGFVKVGNAAMADGDSMKVTFPEYKSLVDAKDVSAAGYVHEESSWLSKQVVLRGLGESRNIHIDGTGDSGVDAVEKRITSWRAAGAKKVVGEYVTCPTDMALARAEERGKRTGRFLAPNLARASHIGVSQTLKGAVDKKLFDEVRLWDTSEGTKPKLVMEQVAGKTTIHDSRLWKAFLDKGSERAY